jgi:limonene-1,2-epoxide hydrolase
MGEEATMIRFLTVGAVCALFLSVMAVPPARAADSPEANAKVVQGFMAAWSGHDLDKIMSYVGDDVRYQNVPPLGPKAVMHGKDAMRAFLQPFFKKDALIVPMTFHTEITRTIADDKGGVAVERVDHQIVAGKDYVNPVAAILTVKDGKIVSWTDYFDGKTFEPVGILMEALANEK